MAHFFRQRAEVGNNHFRLALKARAKLFILRGDAHRAGIQMALPRHHAANRQQRRRAKAKFVGSKNCRQNDITREFQASVHTEREA